MRTVSQTTGTTLNAPTFELQGSQNKNRKRKGLRKYLKRIDENFPNMGKEIVTQVQEVQRVPYRVNPRRNMPKHINQTNKKLNSKKKY